MVTGFDPAALTAPVGQIETQMSLAAASQSAAPA
jgi:hypothetical protein